MEGTEVQQAFVLLAIFVSRYMYTGPASYCPSFQPALSPPSHT